MLEKNLLNDKNQAIALVDCNNFFVACERAVNPKLNEFPVAVLSNNDGCIISRSQEVKAMGVAMGAPLFEVRDVLDKHNTMLISCNHALYREFSEKVLNVLISEAGDENTELYSIDEAFLNIGTSDKLQMFGTHVKDRILKETKIPVSIGMAETKTLSKLANHLAKISAKTMGVLDLYRSRYTDIALERTPVNEVWGIGRRNSVKLNKLGINTALQLKNSEIDQIRPHLHVFGARTVLELNGIKCIPLETMHQDNKSIAHTRTFGRTISTYDEMKNAILHFTTRALEKMRWNGLSAKSITVFLKTDRFKPKPYMYSNSHTYNSIYHSDITSEIYKWTLLCLNNIFLPDLHYKRAGIVLGELTPVNGISKRLYEQEKYERWHTLNRWIDELNLRYGRDVIKLAALQNEGVWRANSTHRENDANHSTEREKLGLGKTFSRPIRFL